MPEALQFETFSPHVDSAFRLSAGDQEEVFILRSVTARAGSAPSPRFRVPFSLFFDGSRTDVMINQQILALTHAEMGELSIFLVPISRNADGTFRYQAAFN